MNQWFIFVIFTSVAPHRGQPAAKCHLRWQPIRRLAVSCGLGRHRIRTLDCRTTVWRATIELPCLPRWNTALMNGKRHYGELQKFICFSPPRDRKLKYQITETILSYLNWFLKTIETGKIQERKYLPCLLEQCT